MGKHAPARTDGQPGEALVKQGGKAEKRLLRQERQAERSLTKARAKLRKAQTRLERWLGAVSEAEALLRSRQAARAVGPDRSNGTSPEALPPSVASATESIARAGDAAPVAVSPVILVDGEAPSGATDEAEPAATLILPPAAKPPAGRRRSRSVAPKEQAS